MDLRQLEYVVAVADHGTFTRAARSVHVSQPSLSHGIRGLEIELGAELFVRLGRSVEVTSAGREVIEAARRVLRDMTDVAAAAASVTSLATGTLDLVVLPTLAVDPLAELIGAFRVRHPGILVRVHEPEDAVDVEDRVRSGRAEIGLTDVSTGARGLVRVELFRQEIVIVSPPESTLDPEPVSAPSLARLPLIVTPPGTSTRRLLDRMLARDGLEPNMAVEISHHEAIVPLVLMGAGSALLPARSAAEAASKGATVHQLRPRMSRRSPSCPLGRARAEAPNTGPSGLVAFRRSYIPLGGIWKENGDARSNRQHRVRRGLTATIAAVALTACSSGQGRGAGNGAGVTQVGSDGATGIGSSVLQRQIDALPKATLTPDEQNGLIRMREEEKLAHDVYVALDATWHLQVFTNISSADQTHTDAVKALLDRHAINARRWLREPFSRLAYTRAPYVQGRRADSRTLTVE